VVPESVHESKQSEILAAKKAKVAAMPNPKVPTFGTSGFAVTLLRLAIRSPLHQRPRTDVMGRAGLAV